MNIFRRLFKIGEAEANSAIDKLENPIKLTEQGIRDLKKDLAKSMESLAQVKAMTIRSRKEMQEQESVANDYQSKAMLLLKKAQNGQMTMEDADRLAKEALIKKDAAVQNAARAKEEVTKFEKSISQLEANIQTIKSNLSKWENELKTLKARVRVTDATKNLNKQLASIDSSSTVSMLEKMKEKVAQEEALAEAYGDIANESKSVDDEIEKALNTTNASADNDLEKLKAQLGMNDDTNKL
ncbi:PspA/IM30 family protein [Aureivirga sp. CE67]|uniref:PspA/IM30 family protein n=1 Tax=Aureivirga sp. CE67 TaxID=1788983 RepID=UPI0018CA8751|nr:PspA/IM30 family protein [Aureivirga sp. CE67]